MQNVCWVKCIRRGDFEDTQEPVKRFIFDCDCAAMLSRTVAVVITAARRRLGYLMKYVGSDGMAVEGWKGSCMLRQGSVCAVMPVYVLEPASVL